MAIKRAWAQARKVCWPLIDNLYLYHRLVDKFDWNQRIPISKEALEELLFIKGHLSILPSRPFLELNLLMVFSDAAGAIQLGWGCHFQHWITGQLGENGPSI